MALTQLDAAMCPPGSGQAGPVPHKRNTPSGPQTYPTPMAPRQPLDPAKHAPPRR